MRELLNRLNNPGWFSMEARARFEQHFGATNNVIIVNGVAFVLIDAPKLVDEEVLRTSRGQTIDQIANNVGGLESVVRFVQQASKQIRVCNTAFVSTIL